MIRSTKCTCVISDHLFGRGHVRHLLQVSPKAVRLGPSEREVGYASDSPTSGSCDRIALQVHCWLHETLESVYFTVDKYKATVSSLVEMAQKQLNAPSHDEVHNTAGLISTDSQLRKLIGATAVGHCLELVLRNSKAVEVRVRIVYQWNWLCSGLERHSVVQCTRCTPISKCACPQEPIGQEKDSPAKGSPAKVSPAKGSPAKGSPAKAGQHFVSSERVDHPSKMRGTAARLRPIYENELRLQ